MFSVAKSCQLQCDKKNVIKTSGKTSHIPIILPLMPVWLKEEFREGITFRLCCKEAGCCIQVITMSKPMIKSTVQRLPSKKPQRFLIVVQLPTHFTLYFMLLIFSNCWGCLCPHSQPSGSVNTCC